MIDNKDNTFTFRIKSERKETFKRKADERNLSQSALLNMFISKYNKKPKETITFLVCD